jgi:hypothetical protein
MWEVSEFIQSKMDIIIGFNDHVHDVVYMPKRGTQKLWVQKGFLIDLPSMDPREQF